MAFAKQSKIVIAEDTGPKDGLREMDFDHQANGKWLAICDDDMVMTAHQLAGPWWPAIKAQGDMGSNP